MISSTAFKLYGSMELAPLVGLADAIVDLKTQKIREVLKPEKDEPIGNLVVHQDMLISQTLTEIAVYPIRK